MNFAYRPTKLTVFVVLVFSSLLLAVAGRGLAGRLRGAAQTVLAPFGDGGMYVVTALRTGGSGPSAAQQRLEAENEQLRDQVADMARRMDDMQETYRRQFEEIEHIRRSAFVPKSGLACELIPARVVLADSLPYGQSRVLTARSAKVGAPVLSCILLTDRSCDLPAGLPVITSSALVGRIERSGAFTAQMRLVTDAGFSVPAKIVRKLDPENPRKVRLLEANAAALTTLTAKNNAAIPVLARGDGVDGLTAEAASIHEIRPGDWLMLREDDPYLRVDVRIGVVREVRPKEKEEGRDLIRIQPLVDLATLRNVYVVYPPEGALDIGGGS